MPDRGQGGDAPLGGRRESLSELDDRLHELQREIARIGDLSREHPTDPGRDSPSPATATAEPGVAERRSISTDAAAIVVRAQDEADRIVASALHRREELEGQIKQLVGLREQLRRSGRQMIVRYEQALSRIEAQFATSDDLGGESFAGPSSASTSEPSTTATSASTSEPSTTAIYSGTVQVRARAVRDLDTISRLEQALRNVEGASGVAVREFVDQSVALELELSTDVALLSELQRVLPFEFTTESTADGEVVLRLRAP
jgi:cell division septum initiation protein DivIVA